MARRTTKLRSKVEPELRKLSVSQDECERLLGMLQHTKTKIVAPEDYGLATRLVDLLYDFGDSVLKIKEQLMRSKSNAFWVDGYIDAAKLKNNGETLREIAHIPAKELRKLLDKERLAQGVALAKQRRRQAAKEGK